MVRNTSYMFVTGPDVIRTVTHEEVTKEELGGAMTHNERSGVAHFAADNDRECILLIRELLSFVPNNNLDEAPRVATADPVDRADEALDALVPQSANQPYDMRDVIDACRRRSQFPRGPRAFRAQYPRRVPRLGGRSVGIVANQPAHLAGTLDIDASIKGRGSFGSATPSTSR